MNCFPDTNMFSLIILIVAFNLRVPKISVTDTDGELHIIFFD